MLERLTLTAKVTVKVGAIGARALRVNGLEVSLMIGWQ